MTEADQISARIELAIAVRKMITGARLAGMENHHTVKALRGVLETEEEHLAKETARRSSKLAADQAADIMNAISPRGPNSLSNEMWNRGHKLIADALHSASSSRQRPTETGDLDVPIATATDAELGAGVPAGSLQSRVDPWLIACFGEEIARDKSERSHRFLEEALELVQAAGCTASEAHQLVDYTYGRPVGELPQEVGGVMITLAALCLAHGVDMHAQGETELARIWTKVEKIRAKQAAKPKHSPLPEHAASPQPGTVTGGWQPIDTAPKDGKGVILAVPRRGSSGWTVGEGYYAKDHAQPDWWWAGETYGDATSEAISFAFGPPEHYLWQSLPTAPARGVGG